MYANVLNARILCGPDTSASISGFSACSWSTIEPIGSSTSGIQMSSWSVIAGSVHDLRLGRHTRRAGTRRWPQNSLRSTSFDGGASPTLRRVDPLALLAAEPELAALFLDVDGVLAPIVERPEDARVPVETQRELARLADTYALVACVTGRTAEFARTIVGVDAIRYVGQHGLELDGAAPAWADRIHAFARSTAWPDLEVKPLTAAFHYRSAPDTEEARVTLEHVATHALDEGFRTKWGRMVLEVVPPIDASQGTAVRALLDETGIGRAMYAGDDVTDLDGFRALDGLDVAVRVAVVSSEGPSELGELAD